MKYRIVLLIVVILFLIVQPTQDRTPSHYECPTPIQGATYPDDPNVVVMGGFAATHTDWEALCAQFLKTHSKSK
jgi:hypothetical protein